MIVVAAVVGLGIGFAIAKMMEKGKASKIIANAKREASNIIKEANKEGENVKKGQDPPGKGEVFGTEGRA